MILSRLAVKRPVATLMFYLGLLLLGAISWFKLPQDLFPPVSYPQVTVVTAYPNAAPEEIETLITKPIEESIATVSHLKKIRSVSREGLSIVTAEFSWQAKMDFAALGVRQKIDLIKERLPREAGEPVVKKLNPFDLPVFVLSVRGAMSEEDLLYFVKKNLKENLSKVSGVATVTVSGGREKEIYVDVDALRLRARNIDIGKITRSLKEANLNYPAGTTKESYFEYLLRTEGEFKNIDEIRNMVIEFSGNAQADEDENKAQDNLNYLGRVKLSDIADVREGYGEISNISRFNGMSNIMISVFKQSDANVIQTVENVRRALAEQRAIRSDDIVMDVVYDKSIFIKDAINGVKSSGLQGGLLAFLVLLVFLQSWVAAFIVAVSIPVSVLVVFILMYFQNFSINMMSLGGLALGTGMLVDNAIVVMENIVRHFTHDKQKPDVAAIDGAGQVGTAIFASTLTTIAVFLPLVFLSGVQGQLFKDLAYTVTFALLASLLVALSLIPRLAYKRLGGMQGSMMLDRFGKIINHAEHAYAIALAGFLKRKTFYLAAVGIFLGISLWIATWLPVELIPKIDEGQFGIRLNMPPGTQIAVTDKEAQKIESHLLGQKNVQNVSLNIGSRSQDASEGSQVLGSHQAYFTVVLKKDRSEKTDAFIRQLYQALTQYLVPEARMEIEMTSSGLGGAFAAKSPVTINVHSDDLESLEKTSREVSAYLQNLEGVVNVKSSRAGRSPETRIQINKERAALMRLSAQDISLSAQTAIKGTIATYYKNKDGQEIPVNVRLRQSDRSNMEQIKRIPLKGGNEQPVYLGDVVTFDQGKGPSEILRVNQKKMVEITADVTTMSVNEVARHIQSVFTGVRLPRNVSVEWVVESADEKESSRDMLFTFILSILLVYMIMAAQFESLKQPLYIMITVPLGLIGVIWALFLTQTPISGVALLGVVMLGGIVVNNGIVLVEYIHQTRKHTSVLEKAVREACLIRFRPIVMTTLTTLLGLLPLAIGLGEGSELRSPMAISVIGGLLVSTLLTLFVLPAIYILFGGRHD